MGGVNTQKMEIKSKILRQKKAMEVNQLYQFVLLIVLVGMIIGVGVLVLDKFSTSSGVTATASSAINNARTEVANIASQWLGLIVTVAVLSIILFLVIRSFGAAGTGRG